MSEFQNTEDLKIIELCGCSNSSRGFDDRPPILYKYRIWDKGNDKDLLKTGTIVFSRPDSFEDPFDCHLPEIYPQGIELLNFYLKDSLEKNPHYNEHQHFEYAIYWYFNSPMQDSSRTMLIDVEFWKRFNEEHGVLCLCKTADISEMWEKYANQYKGYCVGFDAEKLSEQFSGHEVVYCSGIPTIDFINDPDETKIIKEIYYKSSWWDFEKEYRYFICGHGVKLSDSDRLFSVGEYIKEVHLGRDMANDERKVIKDIVKKNYPNAIIID